MNNIRQVRKSRKMTLKNLADRVGVSVPYIYDIEVGNRRGKPTTIQKIADVLGVPVEQIAGDYKQ